MGLVLACSAGCDFVLPIHRESLAPDDGGIADESGTTNESGVADDGGVADAGDSSTTDGPADGDGAPPPVALRQAFGPGEITGTSQSQNAVISGEDLLIVGVYWGSYAHTVQVSDTLKNPWIPLSA
jgi:hypothetical protein